MKLDRSDIEEMRPVVEMIVQQVLAHIERQTVGLDKRRIGFTEPEAAAAIGVRSHVLADARRRGEISARLVGERYIYSRENLVRWISDVE